MNDNELKRVLGQNTGAKAEHIFQRPVVVELKMEEWTVILAQIGGYVLSKDGQELFGQAMSRMLLQIDASAKEYRA